MIGSNFTFGLVPLSIREDAVGWIREPNRTIGLHHQVIGRIQTLALEAVDQHLVFQRLTRFIQPGTDDGALTV